MCTKEVILTKLKDRLSNQNLYLYDEYEKGELEYWDGGNADDTFNLGIEIGSIDELRQIIKMVEEL